MKTIKDPAALPREMFYNRVGLYGPAEAFTMAEDGFIQVLKAGEYPHEEAGVVQVVDEKSVASVFNRLQLESQQPDFPGKLLDLEHWSYDPDKTSEAAAWLGDFQLRNDGKEIWSKPRLTTVGTENFTGGLRRQLSPVFLTKDCEWLDGGRVRPLAVDTWGLTNANNMKGMVPLTNRKSLPKVDVITNGGAGSGSWDGPGSPRFAKGDYTDIQHTSATEHHGALRDTLKWKVSELQHMEHEGKTVPGFHVEGQDGMPSHDRKFDERGNLHVIKSLATGGSGLHGQTLKPGEAVKFHTPNKDDSPHEMHVVEDRGDRVLVQHNKGFESATIKPQSVHMKSELTRHLSNNSGNALPGASLKNKTQPQGEVMLKNALCALHGLDPEKTSDEDVMAKVSAHLKAAADLAVTHASLQNRVTTEFEPKLKTMLEAQVETDLKTYAPVIKNRDEIKKQLLANRDGTLTILAALNTEPTAPAKPAKTPLFNRTQQPTPGDNGKGATDDVKRSQKIANRAKALQKSDGLKWDTAFRQASNEAAAEEAAAAK